MTGNIYSTCPTCEEGCSQCIQVRGFCVTSVNAMFRVTREEKHLSQRCMRHTGNPGYVYSRDDKVWAPQGRKDRQDTFSFKDRHGDLMSRIYIHTGTIV